MVGVTSLFANGIIETRILFILNVLHLALGLALLVRLSLSLENVYDTS